MTAARRVLDVSSLPTVAFGRKDLVAWGTIGFMVIEGFTLALMLASYLYLRKNVIEWPPGSTVNPGLIASSLNTAVLLLAILPMRAASSAAQRFDRRAVALWLSVGALFSLVSVILRWFELEALNVRWDVDAYASAAWGVLLLQGTLLATDLLETGTMAVLFARGPVERKLFPDAGDAATYQYFLSLTQIPVYLIVFWSPRIL